jgi:hypothetical protein
LAESQPDSTRVPNCVAAMDACEMLKNHLIRDSGLLQDFAGRWFVARWRNP